jgi:hypothetical protein
MYKHYRKEENLAKLERGLFRAASLLQSLRDQQQARLARIIV